MIAFQDFAPGQVKGCNPGLAPQWEPFDHAVIAANTWIQQYCIRVINVETLLLPNVWNSMTRGTLEPRLHTSHEMATNWYQVVRVWFEPAVTPSTP